MRLIYFHQNDETPKPTPLHVSEELWRNPVPPVPLIFRRLDPWTFEQFESGKLETALDYSEWHSLVAPTWAYPLPQVFSDDQTITQPAPTLHVDEVHWSNPVAPVFAYPVPKVFADDDVIEVQPTCLGEDYWFNPPEKRMCILDTFVFRDDDVVIPTPPIRDEDLWWNPVAPVPSGIQCPLPYLPDPDELPAGSFIGAIPSAVVGSGQIGGVFGSGVATVPKVTGSGTIRGIKGSGKID